MFTHISHFQSQLVANSVPYGSRQTRANDEHSVTVIGDGRIEPVLMDEFHSATAVQSVKDTRVMAFAREMAPKNAGFIPAEEGQAAVDKYFGKNWTFSQTKVAFSATLSEGEAKQGVRLGREAGTDSVTLWAQKVTDEAFLSQEVEMAQSPGGEFMQPKESLFWVPSQAALAADLRDFRERNRESLKTWVDKV